MLDCVSPTKQKQNEINTKDKDERKETEQQKKNHNKSQRKMVYDILWVCRWNGHIDSGNGIRFCINWRPNDSNSQKWKMRRHTIIHPTDLKIAQKSKIQIIFEITRIFLKYRKSSIENKWELDNFLTWMCVWVCAFVFISYFMLGWFLISNLMTVTNHNWNKINNSMRVNWEERPREWTRFQTRRKSKSDLHQRNKQIKNHRLLIIFIEQCLQTNAQIKQKTRTFVTLTENFPTMSSFFLGCLQFWLELFFLFIWISVFSKRCIYICRHVFFDVYVHCTVHK